ncbi:MAG: hypothetical protein R3200_02100 [Xanthomonadales bacterium]|nr:hypothetical protein [Xanthomonadales bacterium]
MFDRRLIWISVLAAGLLGAAHGAPSLAELADEADLIAVVRVEQVDYEKTRSFPSSGSAFLEILIPYKGDVARGDWIEVKEQGLAESACYYPEPDPFVFEGARFLVLLRADPKEEEVYRGVAPACRIPVLVTSENRYAVLYPVKGLDLPEELAERQTYADPAAVVDATDFTRAQIEELETDYQAEPVERGPFEPNNLLYTYTRGIPLGEVRRLMQLDEATGN